MTMKLTIDHLSNLHKDLLNGMYYDYEETSTKLIDIITIIGSLFFYDINNNKKRNEATLIIPVFDPSFWGKKIMLVTNLFEWITDKPIQLQFVEQIFHTQHELTFLLPSELDISLFYDDLESIAGLILAKDEEFDYIHLVNKNNDKVKQQKLSLFLRDSISNSSEIIRGDLKHFHYTKAKHSASLNLLLLTLASAKVYFNGGKNVNFYQSNKINLDIEQNSYLIDKAAQPKTYELLKAIYQYASLNIHIQLPFLHKTRTDIIKELPKNYKLQIKNTSDCIKRKTKEKNALSLSCGICKQCLQRKMMMAVTENEVYDGFYQYDYGTKIETISNDRDQEIFKETLQSFESLSALIENKLESLSTIEEKAALDFITSYHSFIEKYNPN